MSIATHSSSVAGGMNRKPLILVYGDSIALPRQSEGIAPEDTMAELLAAHYAELGRPRSLYNRSDSGKTITDHRSKYEHDVGLFSAGREDLFIFQGGVVDCAPRPLPPRLRRKLERKPAFIRRLSSRARKSGLRTRPGASGRWSFLSFRPSTPRRKVIRPAGRTASFFITGCSPRWFPRSKIHASFWCLCINGFGIVATISTATSVPRMAITWRSRDSAPPLSCFGSRSSFRRHLIFCLFQLE
jgi:hypothetical protein